MSTENLMSCFTMNETSTTGASFYTDTGKTHILQQVSISYMYLLLSSVAYAITLNFYILLYILIHGPQIAKQFYVCFSARYIESLK